MGTIFGYYWCPHDLHHQVQAPISSSSYQVGCCELSETHYSYYSYSLLVYFLLVGTTFGYYWFPHDHHLHVQAPVSSSSYQVGYCKLHETHYS